MQAQQNNNNLDFLDSLSDDFNGYGVYGLEFILDEIIEQKTQSKAVTTETTNVDWFGLSDLCI